MSIFNLGNLLFDILFHPLVLNIIIIISKFSDGRKSIDILRSIFILFEVLIGFPFRALLATGLYNNIKFDHFPPWEIAK